MPRTATDKTGLSAAGAVRFSSRSRTALRFFALDGTLCVRIEAESEEDARYLCRDARLEFIGICEE